MGGQIEQLALAPVVPYRAVRDITIMRGARAAVAVLRTLFPEGSGRITDSPGIWKGRLLGVGETERASGGAHFVSQRRQRDLQRPLSENRLSRVALLDFEPAPMGVCSVKTSERRNEITSIHLRRTPQMAATARGDPDEDAFLNRS